MRASTKRTAVGASAGVLIAALGAPFALVAILQNFDGRYGGALLIDIATSAIVLVAATLLFSPVVMIERGAFTRNVALAVYLIAAMGSTVVVIALIASGVMFPIFLTIPAITISALIVASIAMRLNRV